MLFNKDSKLIDLPKELVILKDVTGIQLENLKSEVTSFCLRVKKLHEQVGNVETWKLNNLKDFLEVNIFY